MLTLPILIIIILSSCNIGDTNKVLSEETKSLQLVKDELEIRASADKFSDAVNRVDVDAFQAL